MALKSRIQYPAAIYDVMNRGDAPKAIFADDLDRRRFLETLAEVSTENWSPSAGVLPHAKPF